MASSDSCIPNLYTGTPPGTGLGAGFMYGERRQKRSARKQHRRETFFSSPRRLAEELSSFVYSFQQKVKTKNATEHAASSVFVSLSKGLHPAFTS